MAKKPKSPSATKPPTQKERLAAKRQEVARRRVRARIDDANCTSVHEEFRSLIWNGGKGVGEWTERECDDYLAHYDENGQHIEDERSDPPDRSVWRCLQCGHTNTEEEFTPTDGRPALHSCPRCGSDEVRQNDE